MMQIISGLNQSSVQLLDYLWKNQSQKMQAKWKTMNDVMDPRANFSNYRQKILERQTEGKFTIPFLGTNQILFCLFFSNNFSLLFRLALIGRDILFAKEGNSNSFEQTSKVLLGVVKMIKTFQHTNPNITATTAATEFFQKPLVVVGNGDLLFRAALSLRPELKQLYDDLTDVSSDNYGQQQPQQTHQHQSNQKSHSLEEDVKRAIDFPSSDSDSYDPARYPKKHKTIDVVLTKSNTNSSVTSISTTNSGGSNIKNKLSDFDVEEKEVL